MGVEGGARGQRRGRCSGDHRSIRLLALPEDDLGGEAEQEAESGHEEDREHGGHDTLASLTDVLAAVPGCHAMGHIDHASYFGLKDSGRTKPVFPGARARSLWLASYLVPRRFSD